METTHIEELIAKHASGNATASEREQLWAWVGENPEHQVFFDKMMDTWALAGQWPSPRLTVDKNAAWQQVQQRINTAPQVRRATMRKLPIQWIAVAASVLVLLAVGWWMGRTNDEVALQYATTQGERRQITLPDGSTAWLNEASTLSYRFADGQRQLLLQGEAFFDVATDSLHPFTVQAGDVAATVLGTSFNLRAYPEDAQVELSVATGRVALAKKEETAKSTSALEVRAGEAAAFNKTSDRIDRVEAFDVNNTTAWRDQKLVFSEAPLGQVLATLERYFEVQFNVADPALLHCTFIGNYDQPALDEVLNALAFSLDLDVRKEGNTIHLSGQGCQ